MSLRPRRRQSVDINMAPLIDVVFLLLIFFMVSTTFKDESRLRVQLPEAQGEETPPVEEPQMVRVTIDRSGHYFIDGRALADDRPATLTAALSAVLAERKSLPLLIQADAETTHQSVMTAMDAASQSGFARIAFAATHPERPAP